MPPSTLVRSALVLVTAMTPLAHGLQPLLTHVAVLKHAQMDSLNIKDTSFLLFDQSSKSPTFFFDSNSNNVTSALTKDLAKYLFQTVLMYVLPILILQVSDAAYCMARDLHDYTYDLHYYTYSLPNHRAETWILTGLLVGVYASIFGFTLWMLKWNIKRSLFISKSIKEWEGSLKRRIDRAETVNQVLDLHCDILVKNKSTVKDSFVIMK